MTIDDSLRAAAYADLYLELIALGIEPHRAALMIEMAALTNRKVAA